MKSKRAIHSALVIWMSVAAATLAASSVLTPTMRFACVGFCAVGLIASYGVERRRRRIQFYSSSSPLQAVRPDRSQPSTPRVVNFEASDKSIINA